MGVKTEYPEIPFSEDEKKREQDLGRLSRAFQEEMERRRNPCALKGGTALRMKLGLPRPSTDLDFEGDGKVNVRKAVRTAVKRAFGTAAYTVGMNLLWRGTVKLKPNRGIGAHELGSKLDYRQMGRYPGMPPKVPIEKCEWVDGTRVYDDRELVRRKLQTMTGPRPRAKARDIYDTGWIATVHPELIAESERQALKKWSAGLTAEDEAVLRRELREDNMTARVDAEEILTAVKNGIARLGTEPARTGDLEPNA